MSISLNDLQIASEQIHALGRGVRGGLSYYSEMYNTLPVPVWIEERGNRPQREIVHASAAEIHQDFQQSAERLLLELDPKAPSVYDFVSDEQDQALDTLRNLGFTGSQTFNRLDKQKQAYRNAVAEYEVTSKLHRASAEYRRHYPLNRLIDEETVKRLCNKYGLIYGPVDRYTGTVPHKNAQEMAAFSGSFNLDDHGCYEARRIWRGNEHLQYGSRAECESRYLALTQGGHRDRHNFEFKPCPWQIAAPSRDFNTDGMELNGLELVKTKVIDPIVLAPVHFEIGRFFLIVTAWGEEAADPDVINPVQN